MDNTTLVPKKGYSLYNIFNSTDEEIDSMLKLYSKCRISKTRIKSVCYLVIYLYHKNQIIIEHRRIIDNELIYSMLSHPSYIQYLLEGIDNRKNILTIFRTLISSFELGWMSPGCVYPEIKYPVTRRYNDHFITKYRNKIYRAMIDRLDSNNPKTITVSDIEYMSDLYFKYFIPHKRNKAIYEISTKCKKSTGKTDAKYTTHSCVITIRIGITAIFEKFNGDNVEIEIDGIPVNNRLSAIQITLEHELCHYLIDNTRIRLNNKDKIYDEHGKFFKQLSNAYFGHTKTFHKLHEKKIDYSLYKIDQPVTFMLEDEEVEGTIIKINKRNLKIEYNDEYYNVPYELLCA